MVRYYNKTYKDKSIIDKRIDYLAKGIFYFIIAVFFIIADTMVIIIIRSFCGVGTGFSIVSATLGVGIFFYIIKIIIETEF